MSKNVIWVTLFAAAVSSVLMAGVGRGAEPVFAQTSTSCLMYNEGPVCRTVQTCTWFDTRSMQCGQWQTDYYRLPGNDGGSGGSGGSPVGNCGDPRGDCPIPVIQ